MIEELHSHPVYTDDACGAYRLIRPSTSEIIDKLNEIIDVVNKLEAASDNKKEESKRCLEYMTIIVSFTNFRNDLKDMMEEIADRISIVQPIVDYKSKLIEIKLQTHKNIVILFKPAFSECIKGTRPDYYWTNSYDVDKYYKYCPDVKRLQNFKELTSLVLTECQKDD